MVIATAPRRTKGTLSVRGELVEPFGRTKQPAQVLRQAQEERAIFGGNGVNRQAASATAIIKAILPALKKGGAQKAILLGSYGLGG